MATTLNGNSVGQRGQPSLNGLVRQTPAQAASKQGGPGIADQPQAVKPHRLAWAMPAVWVVWLVAGLTGLAAALEAPNGIAAAALVGLTAVMGLAWTVQDWRVRRQKAEFELAYGSAALIGVAALGLVAVFAGTALTPIVLVLPLAVGVLAIAGGSRSMTEAGLAAALGALLVLALRATIGLDEPVAATVMLVGGSAALTVGAFVYGQRLRGVEIDAATARDARPRANRKAIEGARLKPETLEQLREADDPLEVVRIAVEILQQSGNPAYVAISELVPDTDILMPLVEHGAIDIDPEKIRDGMVTLSRDAITDGRERIHTDGGQEYGSLVCHKLGLQAALVVPLRRLNRTVGVIHVAWTKLDERSAPEDALATSAALSDWVTPDLAIASIASEIERGYVGAMTSVSASLESRDGHTDGHSRRVARVALEIAELLRLGEHEQRQLVYAAGIHDLGRVGVSDRILEKPGALTDEEWSQIKMIPTLGAEIVEPVSFFGEVREAILHMRERWDGGGYPHGVPGTQIPLLARILSVADAYDAMTSPRPYRAAMSPPDALRQLWRERGSRFDPRVVEIFVEHRAKGQTAG